MNKIEALLPFIREIDRLKTIERQSLIHCGGRRENTAEHSWHLALSVLVMHSLAPEKIDGAKAVKMALLHDLVEIDAGDTFVYDDLSQKHDKELAAIDRLTALLPEPIGTEFKSLWIEFEDGESAEAKFVSAIDRFLPVYSNVLNEGHSWQKHGISVDRVVARIQPPIEDGFPALWSVTEEMLASAVTSGHLASPSAAKSASAPKP